MSRTQSYVFVYGTLKRGFINHDAYLSDQTFISVATTTARYPLFVAGPWNSPILLNEPNHGHKIEGELFEVTSFALKRLDILERVDKSNGYYRSSIRVYVVQSNISPSKTIQAWVYFKKEVQIDRQKIHYLQRFPEENDYIPLALRE